MQFKDPPLLGRVDGNMPAQTRKKQNLSLLWPAILSFPLLVIFLNFRCACKATLGRSDI